MCKHKTVTINELGVSYTQHCREKDGEWTHYSDYDHYTGKIEVNCPDCGLEKTYGLKNRPKWLTRYIKEFVDK